MQGGREGRRVSKTTERSGSPVHKTSLICVICAVVGQSNPIRLSQHSAYS